jgi:hypothetical protein
VLVRVRHGDNAGGREAFAQRVGVVLLDRDQKISATERLSLGLLGANHRSDKPLSLEAITITKEHFYSVDRP